MNSCVSDFSLSTDERLLSVHTVDNELIIIPTLDYSYKNENIYKRYTNVLKYEWNPSEPSSMVYFSKDEIYSIRFDKDFNETSYSFTKPFKIIDFSYVFINGTIITIDSDNSLDLYDFNDGKHIRNIHKINDLGLKPLMIKQISKYLYIILLKKEDGDNNGSYAYCYNIQEGKHKLINEKINDKLNYSFLFDNSSNIHENIIMMINNDIKVLRKAPNGINGDTWIPIDLNEYNLNDSNNLNVQGISKCNDSTICVLHKDMKIRFYFRIYNVREKRIINEELEKDDHSLETKEENEQLLSDNLIRMIEKIKKKKVIEVGKNLSKSYDRMDKSTTHNNNNKNPINKNGMIVDNNVTTSTSSLYLNCEQFCGMINHLKKINLSAEEINTHIEVLLCYISKTSLMELDHFKFIFTGSEWISPREMVYIPLEGKYMKPPYSFYYDILKPYNIYCYEKYKHLNFIVKTKHILDNDSHNELNEHIHWPNIIKQTLELVSTQKPFIYKSFIFEIYDAMINNPLKWESFPVLLDDEQSFKDLIDPSLVLRSSSISVRNFSYPYIDNNERYFQFLKSFGIDDLSKRCKKHKWNAKDIKNVTSDILPPKEEMKRFEEALKYHGSNFDRDFEVYFANELNCTFMYEIRPGEYEEGDKQSFSYYLFTDNSNDILQESDKPYIVYTPLFEKNIYKLLAQKLTKNFNSSLTKIMELYLKKKIDIDDCIDAFYNECDYIKQIDRINQTINTKVNQNTNNRKKVSFNDKPLSKERHYSLGSSLMKSNSLASINGYVLSFPPSTIGNNSSISPKISKITSPSSNSQTYRRRNSITSTYGKTIYEKKVLSSTYNSFQFDPNMFGNKSKQSLYKFKKDSSNKDVKTDHNEEKMDQRIVY